MATTCGLTTPSFNRDSDGLLQSKPIEILMPGAYPLQIEVYKEDGKCNGKIVTSPDGIPTFVVDDPVTIEVYACTDLLTKLIDTTISPLQITDGYLLRYVADTFVTPLDVVGRYVALFIYTRDGGLDRYAKPIYFNAVALSCPLTE